MTRSIRSANAEFQIFESLRTNRQKRNRENAFIVEGVRNVDAALANGWTVRSALTGGHARSAWSASIRDRVDDVVELEPALFAALTDRSDPPEVLLVVEKRRLTLDDIGVGARFVASVLDRPTYPGNIGTIVRTCDALGSAALLVTGHGADPYDPRCIRASTGSFFAVPIVEVEGADQLSAWSLRMNVTLVATDEAAPTPLADMPAGRIALLFGNESAGLSRALRDAAHAAVSIPMSGTASSLNVAAAHAIVLFAAVSSR